MFDPKAYGEEVASLLALDGNGTRLMPLAMGRCSSPEALHRLQAAPALQVLPKTALAGLYVYFSCMDQAHEIAQDIASAEGSYWHAIVHRQEPDAGNAAYWFRQVGAHAIFPALRARAAEIGVDLGPQWDPFAFIELCERARTQPGSAEERKALEVQRAEWQLLFDHCAR